MNIIRVYNVIMIVAGLEFGILMYVDQIEIQQLPQILECQLIPSIPKIRDDLICTFVIFLSL